MCGCDVTLQAKRALALAAELNQAIQVGSMAVGV